MRFSVFETGQPRFEIREHNVRRHDVSSIDLSIAGVEVRQYIG